MGKHLPQSTAVPKHKGVAQIQIYMSLSHDLAKTKVQKYICKEMSNLHKNQCGKKHIIKPRTTHDVNEVIVEG